MGEQKAEKLFGNPDKLKYIEHLLSDIEALEEMLKKDMFEKSPIRIGAEQELCLVNESWEPTNKAMEVLKSLDDAHFTNELALYNLEINMDPIPLKGNCFSKAHQQLKELLAKVDIAAEKQGLKVILTGILPTIGMKHLSQSYLTPVKRYKELNEILQEIRKNNIELHIKGVDEVNLHHDTILFEGCNTSFQSHLQIAAENFMEMYNWSQAIAGPILSICANSPILLGKELWEETRIALFTQSIDTRRSTFLLNERESRVGFGNGWATGTIVDFFKDSIIHFRSLLTSSFDTNSLEELQKGNVPKLKALNLHNGTIYKWNRPCYGTTNGKPHIRIECRYIPSGPSIEDEIANMMLWVGVMKGMPKEYRNIHKKMNFKDAKSNFFNAARYGTAAQFHWNQKLISSHDLLLDHFLPWAFKGLYSMNVDPKDAEHYLSIIENRIKTMNGSRWTINAYRKLKETQSTSDALKNLVATMYDRQQKGYPIDIWKLPKGDEYVKDIEQKKTGDLMNTKIVTAQDSDSAELVLKMMQWKNIHHVPVLDDNNDLTGLLTWTDVQHYANVSKKSEKEIQHIMKKELVTITADTNIKEAKKLMKSNKINCLPVVNGNKLVGIITSNDF